ncbi:SseB family protein [Sulfitobacter mediterraneus]|jgi:type III secretion system (T3SS) SseB-like protein|uniref:SseB family protein n=1 Tax=Sulfitobacter TaxID=60136 RepID=UPI0019334559|nr:MULTISPECIES: SseB family protein [Sulfitobacter]MBM1633840.1 SseB family protein [Sulfitobacter mediterraneus]MBM1641645.1 SseB family protein [Sulfitobacter mediterraneus]MBM1645704.1 SseB family protein [Sulfitobacter mediterraneus]MBM1649764.1 SseB family protein [Sulfitobacter mediterraneus]MBM1653773.1 SseB family protein [Sulfitobacter mediterraneus]
MTDLTPLDEAHAAMTAAPDDDTARLRFYERIADVELFMLLEAEPEGDQINPILLDDAYVVVFDRAARLAAYVGEAAPYVALSGRAIAGMLEGQPLGMAVNIGVAPSEILLPAGAMEWLRDTLAHEAGEVEAKIEALLPPKGLPETLIAAIDAKLATATGMAAGAFLVAVDYAGGGRGHLLAFVGAIPRAQDALVRAASEALTFSGIEAGAMDVGFFAPNDPTVEKLARVGLRFDLPQGEGLQHTPRMPPGSDPSKPPILK